MELHNKLIRGILNTCGPTFEESQSMTDDELLVKNSKWPLNCFLKNSTNESVYFDTASISLSAIEAMIINKSLLRAEAPQQVY